MLMNKNEDLNEEKIGEYSVITNFIRQNMENYY